MPPPPELHHPPSVQRGRALLVVLVAGLTLAIAAGATATVVRHIRDRFAQVSQRTITWVTVTASTIHPIVGEVATTNSPCGPLGSPSEPLIDSVTLDDLSMVLTPTYSLEATKESVRIELQDGSGVRRWSTTVHGWGPKCLVAAGDSVAVLLTQRRIDNSFWADLNQCGPCYLNHYRLLVLDRTSGAWRWWAKADDIVRLVGSHDSLVVALASYPLYQGHYRCPQVQALEPSSGRTRWASDACPSSRMSDTVDKLVIANGRVSVQVTGDNTVSGSWDELSGTPLDR